MWLGKYSYGWLPLLVDGHMEDHHLGKIPILWGKPLLLGTCMSSNTSLIFLTANYFAKAFFDALLGPGVNPLAGSPM